MNQSQRVTVLGLYLSCLYCSSDSAPVPTPPTTTAKPHIATQDGSGVHTAGDANVFMYSAIGKRDPFRSYLTDLAQWRAGQNDARHREETESLELDQYRLTGIISGISRPKAMVEEPNGRGHVVHIGSRMGKAGGRITRIAPTYLVVVEETRDPSGKRILLPITMKLPKQEGDDAETK